MPTIINTVTELYTKELKKLFGNNLYRVILYGSYARGDFNKNSDVDIMILVSLSEEAIFAYRDSVSDLSFEFFLNYNVDISAVIKNSEHYNQWSENLLFYKNIKNEGVMLYG